MSTDDPDYTAAAERLLAIAAARVAPTAPKTDPIAARRVWLGDRAQALLDGGYPPVIVDELRSDRLIATDALDHARRFAAAPAATILVLHGGTGAGKTTAGAWLARELGGSRPGLIRSTALERAGRYDHDHGAWVASRTFLTIDDLGVEYMDGKGAFLSLLDELIDIAYGHRRRIVITTNMDQQGISDRVGDRVWSRIVEVATIAGCGNVDLRHARRAG